MLKTLEWSGRSTGASGRSNRSQGISEQEVFCFQAAKIRFFLFRKRENIINTLSLLYCVNKSFFCPVKDNQAYKEDKDTHCQGIPKAKPCKSAGI